MALEHSPAAKYQEMVETPLERLIIRMSVPSVISLLITSVYNLADTYFVGRLGTSATGAVGLVYPLMTLISALGLMFGKGTGTLMGRQLGRQETAEAQRTAVQGLVCVLVLVSLLMALGLLFLQPLAALLGATESMQAYTVVYARYILLAMPFKAAATALSCILRFQGFSKRAMYGLGSGAVLNILLDPLLIFHAGMGFAGAGAATLTGEVVSFFVLLRQTSLEGCIPIRLRNFTPSWSSFLDILRGGFSSFLKNGLSSLASVLLNRAAKPYGDAAVAAFLVVNRLVHICQQIYFGIGEGYQTVCSYNYGAGQYRRVKQGFWFCIKLGAALLVVIAAAFLFPEQMIAVFRREDPEVIRYGSWILQAHMATLSLLPVCSTGFVMLQGIGRNRDAALIGSGRQGLFLVPLILVLPRFFGLPGLIAVQPCSDVLSTLLGAAILRPNLRALEDTPPANANGKE
ncbi:MAG: MATE family efflux transporter [Oscillibacter sp.]|nr:MATE family efflux transporter [Oscillibacter sp.]